MNVYLSATVTGLVGLALMAALGLAHGHSPGTTSHAHPAAGHGGHGPAHSGAHHSLHPGQAHSGAGHSVTGHSASGHHSPSWGSRLAVLASPRVLLSIVLGFGLSGLMLTSLGHWPAALLLGLSGAGGMAFELLLVRPYWNALMAFQSRPSRSLGSTVLSRADAVTDFDERGHGLVALEYEGEIRQLLATLSPGEHGRGLRVRRGDHLRVEAVDEARSRCTVSSLN